MTEENTPQPEAPVVDTNAAEFKPWGMELKQFCMFMHLSQLAGFIIPMSNIVLPILMWYTNKDKSDVIDQHGKNILNWMISTVIYYLISGILMFILIGFLTIFVVAVCSIIFTIMGAVKANKGEVYKYPLSITILK